MILWIKLLLLAGLACILDAAYLFEGMDVYIKNTTSGMLTGGIAANIPHTFESQILLSHGYAWLYKAFPSIPWYDVFMILFTTLTVGLGFSLLKDHDGQTNQIVLWAFVIVFLRLFTLIEVTVAAFFLSYFSLLHLHRSTGYSGLKKIGLIAALITGGLMRLDSLLLAVLIYSLYALFRSRRFVTAAAFPAILTCILVLGIVNIPMSEEAAYFKEIRPYQYALWDFKSNIDEVELENKECLSAIKELTSVSFLSDDERLTPDFFRAIGLVAKDKYDASYWVNFFSSTYAVDKLQRLKAYLFSDPGIVIMGLVGVIAGLILLSAQRLFLLAIVFLFAGVALILKLEHHIIMLFSLLIVFHFFMGLRLIGKRLHAVLVIAIIALSAFQLVTDVNQRRDVHEFYRTNLPATDEMLCIDVTLTDKLNTRIFSHQRYPDMLTFDNGIAYMMNELDEFHQRIDIPPTYEDVFNYLAQQQMMLYSAQEGRTDLHLAYLQACYGYQKAVGNGLHLLSDGTNAIWAGTIDLAREVESEEVLTE